MNQSIFLDEGCINCKLTRSKILTITDNFEINVGISKITLGTHNEFSQSKNVFFVILVHTVMLT
jgi:hypothetical protein